MMTAMWTSPSWFLSRMLRTEWWCCLDAALLGVGVCAIACHFLFWRRRFLGGAAAILASISASASEYCWLCTSMCTCQRASSALTESAKAFNAVTVSFWPCSHFFGVASWSGAGRWAGRRSCLTGRGAFSKECCYAEEYSPVAVTRVNTLSRVCAARETGQAVGLRVAGWCCGKPNVYVGGSI